MTGWTWFLFGALAATTLSAACSDDGGGTGGSNEGGAPDAGASGRSPSSGEGGVAMGGTETAPGQAGFGGSSGAAGSDGGGGPSGGAAEGGGPSGGAAEGGGPSGGAAEGGGPGVAGGGGGEAPSAAGAGGGGPSPEPTLACPAIGQTVTYRASQIHSEDVYAAAARVGCSLLDDRDLKVRRFQVTAPSVFVAYAGHTLTDYFEAMRLDEDCGPAGVVASASTNPFVSYPAMVVEQLPAGIYTSVSCGTRVETLVEAPSAPPTNVDCAHAKLLTGSKLAESRILDAGSRFYRVTVAEPNPEEPGVVKSKLLVSFLTAQTNANATGTLTGLSTPYPAQTDALPYMLDDVYLTWSDLSAGNYCVEIKARPGVKYEISAWAEALL